MATRGFEGVGGETREEVALLRETFRGTRGRRCAPEGTSVVNFGVANFGEKRLGWEVGWRREDSKVSEEKLVRRWHRCAERFEEREAEDADPEGTSVANFGMGNFA